MKIILTLKLPDTVDNGYPDIFDRPQQILISDQIPALHFNPGPPVQLEQYQSPPDCAAVGAPDVLAEVVQEHSIHPVVPVQHRLNVLLVLANSQPEISVTNLSRSAVHNDNKLTAILRSQAKIKTYFFQTTTHHQPIK